MDFFSPNSDTINFDQIDNIEDATIHSRRDIYFRAFNLSDHNFCLIENPIILSQSSKLGVQNEIKDKYGIQFPAITIGDTTLDFSQFLMRQMNKVQINPEDRTNITNKLLKNNIDIVRSLLFKGSITENKLIEEFRSMPPTYLFNLQISSGPIEYLDSVIDLLTIKGQAIVKSSFKGCFYEFNKTYFIQPVNGELYLRNQLNVLQSSELIKRKNSGGKRWSNSSGGTSSTKSSGLGWEG